MSSMSLESMRYSRSPRTHEQLRRVLTLIGQLSLNRFGHSLSEIRSQLNEATGISFCERTVKRDLQLLEELGLVEQGGRNWSRTWKLVSTSRTPLSSVLPVAMGFAASKASHSNYQ